MDGERAMATEIQIPVSEFLGLPFARRSIRQILDRLAARPVDSAFAYLVTPNVDHMVRLTEQEQEPSGAALWRSYREAALVLCDSRILKLLAKLRGVSLSLVTGSDLTIRLFDEVIRPGDRITLIGGDEATIGHLAGKYPGLSIRQHLPPMGLRHNPVAIAEAAAFVAAEPARFIFFAVGSPQQELLALAVKEKGQARGIGLCVGASIEFVVGSKKRAPRLLQRLALEWLHRLVSDPHRLWRRYLIEGPRILRAVIRWKRIS